MFYYTLQVLIYFCTETGQKKYTMTFAYSKILIIGFTDQHFEP